MPFHLPRLAPLGSAVLVHGNLPPAVIRGRRWWRDRRLRALARPADDAAPVDDTEPGDEPTRTSEGDTNGG